MCLKMMHECLCRCCCYCFHLSRALPMCVCTYLRVSPLGVCAVVWMMEIPYSQHSINALTCHSFPRCPLQDTGDVHLQDNPSRMPSLSVSGKGVMKALVPPLLKDPCQPPTGGTFTEFCGAPQVGEFLPPILITTGGRSVGEGRSDSSFVVLVCAPMLCSDLSCVFLLSMSTCCSPPFLA